MITIRERNILTSELMQILDKKECGYYNLALEIGISQFALRNFLFCHDKKTSKKVEEKIKKYLKTPEPLSINEINLLQAQNEGLKKQNANLQQENARLKEKLRFDCLKCKYKNTKADVDKYKQALVEMKETAERELSLTDEDDELREVFLEILQKIAEVG